MRTIPLSQKDNVATFPLAPGYENFELFCCEADLLGPSDTLITLPSGVITDDENDLVNEVKPVASTTLWTGASETPDDLDLPKVATTIDFNLDGPPTSTPEGEGTASTTSTINIITDEEDRQPEDLALLLMYHHQYGHISMRKLQEMAKQCTIPKRLASCRVPICSACLYSKATRKPWRGKGIKDGKKRSPSNSTRPDCVG
jgi:hypothetical protein